jgi:hypothetical protein
VGGPLAQLTLDRLHHRIQILIQFMIPKSQDEISVRAKNRVAALVPNPMLVIAMLTAIELDDKLGAMLDEIEKIGLERRLTPEVITNPI